MAVVYVELDGNMLKLKCECEMNAMISWCSGKVAAAYMLHMPSCVKRKTGPA